MEGKRMKVVFPKRASVCGVRVCGLVDYKSISMSSMWVCSVLCVMFRSACRLPRNVSAHFMELIIFEKFLPYEVNFNYSYILFWLLPSSQSSQSFDTNGRSDFGVCSSCDCISLFIFFILSASGQYAHPQFTTYKVLLVGTRHMRIRNA